MRKKHKVLQPPARIGIIGGGQLGKMITVEAKKMGYYVTILDPTPFSPAGQVADEQIIASFMDRNAIEKLAGSCDVTTYEFEHIDADMLINLEAKGNSIYPSGKSLKKIQDKYIQKTMLRNAGIPVPDFFRINDKQDILQCIDVMGLPLILKTCAGGYDGKGNRVLKARSDIEQALEEFKGYDLMAEQLIEFERELSIIVARNLKNEYAFYPIAENVHEDNILRLTKVPSGVDEIIVKRVRDIAAKIMEVIDDYGVFCIEMFLVRNGELYVNEIAPRPHNSGHYTVEACVTSQFEQLVRVITGMPLGSTEQRFPCVMVNILGSDTVEGPYRFEGIEDVLCEADIHLHLYGKQYTKKMKKIGHITVLDKSIESAEKKALKALERIKIKPLSGDDDMPELEKSIKKQPKVGIIMGSDSDFYVMNEVSKVLKELDIEFEMNVVSAHRTPDKMYDYAKTAEDRGISVIIAGAGGSAHLPGMVASLTCIPVIGVPIKSKSLGGVDSLLSIVQMPAGIPVATVSINGGADAGLLAARMLGVKNPEIRNKLLLYLNKTSASDEINLSLNDISV